MSTTDLPFCSVTEGGIILSLLIQPRASRNEICGIQENELKIRLTSPPVEGAANKLCCEYLAKLFGVSKSSVTLISGETSRHKRVRINGADPAALQMTITSIISKN